MVTATLNRIDLIDTEDPRNPKLISVTQCPSCSLTHDANFTPDGEHVIVGDEGGAGGTYPCPGGALHFYDVVGDAALVWKGMYVPDRVVTQDHGQATVGSCTSHVFDISKDGRTLAISWYGVGTRYLNISTPMGFGFGSTTAGGVEELGWFQPEDGVSWSSKIFKGWIYSNHLSRGFDVYKVEK